MSVIGTFAATKEGGWSGHSRSRKLPSARQNYCVLWLIPPHALTS